MYVDLSLALNYGQGTGSTQLIAFLERHIKVEAKSSFFSYCSSNRYQLYHDPPYADWACILTGGNTSALDLAFRILAERGDFILVEEYTYPTALETGVPLGMRFVGVKMDGEGMLPDHLNEILDHWDPDCREGKKPHLLYIIPTGQNPSGATQSLARRKEIYKVAQRHDLYILEDDPYYFIQMKTETPTSLGPKPTLSQEDFMKSIVPSYLRLDTDGRVLRMDSFSKIIAPGSRTGWITASEQVIERFIRAHETSLQNPSGFSQVMLYKLLHDSWGHAGMMHWLSYLQTEYAQRRDNLITACKAHLPLEVVSWVTPMAGFFVSASYQRFLNGFSVDYFSGFSAHVRRVRTDVAEGRLVETSSLRREGCTGD